MPGTFETRDAETYSLDAARADAFCPHYRPLSVYRQSATLSDAGRPSGVLAYAAVVDASTPPKWLRRLTDLSLPVGFIAILWLSDSWSPTQAGAAFGLYALCIGAAQQFHRPTTPGSRRVFALLFVLVCLGAVLLGDLAEAATVIIAITCVAGWTIGLGLAASFDPLDRLPVRRSFSDQVTRRG